MPQWLRQTLMLQRKRLEYYHLTLHANSAVIDLQGHTCHRQLERRQKEMNDRHENKWWAQE